MTRGASSMGGQARLPGAVVGVIGRMLDDSDQLDAKATHG